jgi:dTDP-3-amino-3,4,6-trideoxy-alpha-D-glucose transaminase
MKIPQANPLAETLELKSEIDAAIERVLIGGQYINGPEVSAFEREFARYLGVNFACGVASGTDALHLGLCALDVKAGDEVITVSHTAVATVAAIEMCGARPVLVDIDPETYTMDPVCLEKEINSHTRVILPVHLYGHPADLTPMLEIANRYGLKILEDCAQAHGAVYKGRRAGGWGDLAIFSFYPTKNLGAIGDGGMVVSHSSELVEKVRLLREYGWRSRYISDVPGYNSRLDEIQAAILRVKLKHLDEHNAMRHSIAMQYTQSLSQCVETPVERDGCYHVYHLYVIRCLQRDDLRDYLAKQGIGTGIHYPVPVHLQPAYRRLSNPDLHLRITEEISSQILSLPMYPQMSGEMAREVIQQIQDFFNDHAAR